MPVAKILRNSNALRTPLMLVLKMMFSPLKSRSGLIRRAAYDSAPMPYLVAGDQESYIVSTKDKVIGRSIFLEGGYDLHKLLLATKILRDRNCSLTHIIDVGSNIGSIVIPAIKRGLFASATAIEPHPENFRLLSANVALNGLSDRIQVMNRAVGTETDAILRMAESANNSGNHMIAEQGLPVITVRLDDVISFSDGVLIWMDIEGYEGHALAGAPHLLSAGTAVVAEYNPQFLANHGGLDMLEAALSQHDLFDLNRNGEATHFEEMRVRYRDSATDFVALKRA